MITTRLRACARSLIESAGYTIFNREFMPYGVLPFVDIERLSRRLDYPIRTLFDVGANLGQTAERALEAFPLANIYCFEPHPDTFARLQARLAGRDRVSLYNVALGRESGRMLLYEHGHSEVSSLFPNSPYAVRSGRESKSRTVDVTTLDDFCTSRDIQQIDVLKIDTEGFDTMVVKGSTDMLRRRAVKFIYSEYNFVTLREGIGGGSLQEMDDLLAPYGFKFVSSYTDLVATEGDIFVNCNALFALSLAGT